MPDTELVTIDPETEIFWDQLPADKLNEIMQTLTFLAKLPTEEWPRSLVRRLGTEEPPLYLLRLDNGFRVTFRRDANNGSRLIAEQVFLQELIDFMYSSKPNPTSKP